MYNSHEERAMIHAATPQPGRPGSRRGGRVRDSCAGADAQRFRAKHNIQKPFAIYIGRIDENKGCKELFDFFLRYAATFPRGLDLVLIGSAIIPIPQHPRIHHLGFLPDEDKFDGIAASDLLIMPSYFESLSMVALEAWAMGRPVLANGRCDVLKGQCIRSGAGSVLRALRGVRRDAVRARIERPAARAPRPQRPRLFYRALHLAGDRAQVSRYVRPAQARGRGRRIAQADRAAARMVRATATRSAARLPRSWLTYLPERPSPVREPRATSPVPHECCAHTSRPRVHQVLATLGYGDAIGHEVLGIQRVLRRAGYESEIFVETADPRLEDLHGRLSRSCRSGATV